MLKNRKKASIINSFFAVSAQFLNLIFSFVSRTIFIRILGEDYLGLNGLFTNLLSILSFAELGIGSAIVFSMYKPLNSGDVNQVKALMLLYKKCYYIVAMILAFGGGIILLFLPKLIAGKYNVGNIYLAFILYLSSSIFSYFWSYKRSIFIADQRGFINSLNQLLFNVIMQILQILSLIIYRSYYIYLIIQIIFTIVSNWQISNLANKNYPYLKEKVTEPVDPNVINYLKKNVVGMISSKIGGVVVYGTDNLLLSSFIGLIAVGQYSNYMLIINGVTSLINQGLGAVTSSIGNLRVSSTKNKQLKIFFQYSQLVSYVSFFVSMFMILFFPPFISFWIGSKFILSPKLSLLIVLSFFVTSLRYSNLNFMNAYGTYWEMRYKSIVEATVNLVISFLLVKFTNLGISAVVLGTLISNICVNSWWEPLIVLKIAIKTSLREYFRFYIISLISGSFLILFVQKILQLNKINVFVSAIICLFISILSLFIFHIITITLAFPKKIERLTLSKSICRMKEWRGKV